MAAKAPVRKRSGAEPRRPAKPPVPGWAWLAVGCGLGAFAMFLASLKPVPAPPQAPGASAPTQAPEAPVATPAQEVQKPRYDFYRLLKETQPSLPTREPTTKPATDASAPDTSQYLLQVASYKTPEEAENLRAKLLLLNLNARVEKVTLRNADLWHRVLIGPIKSSQELQKTRAILQENHYDALVLKPTP